MIISAVNKRMSGMARIAKSVCPLPPVLCFIFPINPKHPTHNPTTMVKIIRSETVINCNQRGTFDPDLILWTIIVFPLLVLFGFLLKMKRRTGGRGQMLLKILAWTLYLLSIPLVIIWMFIGFLSLFGIPLDL